MKRLKRWGLGLGLAAAVLALDQLTKALILQRLELYRSVKVLGSFLKFTLVLNPNTVFGLYLGKNFPYVWVISAIALFVLIALFLEKSTLGTIAYGLILGGALGNLLDRVRIGAVVDFINIGVGRYRWPYFNLADSAVVVGIGLLLIVSFRRER